MRQTSTKQIQNHYQIQDYSLEFGCLIALSSSRSQSKKYICKLFALCAQGFPVSNFIEVNERTIKELNSYLGNKKVELFDMGVGVTMTNHELVNTGRQTMDETNQAIERTKKFVENTIEVGTQIATTLKGQLDTIHFSIKKASQLVKEIGSNMDTNILLLYGYL
ncbi:hypothetical protein UlMin_038783 [Ulmus minor]